MRLVSHSFPYHRDFIAVPFSQHPNADFLMRRISLGFVLTLPFMCILYQILLLYSFIRK